MKNLNLGARVVAAAQGSLKAVSTLVLVMMMTACGGSSSNENREDSDIDVDTSGVSKVEPVAKPDPGRAIVANDAIKGWPGTLSVLLAAMPEGSGNLAFSPWSLEGALNSLSQLAGGQTRVDLLAYLAADGTTAVPDSPDKAMLVADRLLVAEDLPRKESSDLPAMLEPYDFSSAGAAAAINQWVSEKTKGKISSMLDPAADLSTMRLLVLNALYFKQSWLTRFDVELTTVTPFETGKGVTRPVSMMKAPGQTLNYADLGDYHAVAIPFQGQTFAYVVMMPKSFVSIKDFATSLATTDLISRTLKLTDFSPQRVNLGLPRHKLEFGTDLLVPLVQSGLGSITAKADFSPLTTEPISVSAVKQKVTIEIDEEGAEASAATAIMSTRSFNSGEDDVINFMVDHPFLGMIVALDSTGTPVVIELVGEP